MSPLALIVPVVVGLIYLALFGAPTSLIAINAIALTGGVIWILFGRVPQATGSRLLVSLGLITLLAIPSLTGPDIDGIARWLSMGGFTLHIGMLVIPLLAVLSASLGRIGAVILLVAILVAFAQPDTASALALAFTSLGVLGATRDWAFGAVGALGLFAALGASFQGNLPPQPFVEHILPELWKDSPIMAVVVASALLASLAVIAIALPTRPASRFALAGALCGFVVAALLANYPYPLVGYGAASILGFALALSDRNVVVSDWNRRLHG